jgi:hypothetical protein
MSGAMLSVLQGGLSMLQERRQYQRLSPSSPQLVLLDESKYSLLFDLSEGGLALEGFTAKNPHDVISLEFDLPEGNGCIQAQAEVAWTSESGYRTGLRFLEIPATSRQHLRDWISSTSAKKIAALENEFGQPILAPTAPGPVPVEGSKEAERPLSSSARSLQHRFEYRSEQFSRDQDAFGSEGNSGNLAAIFVAAVLMSSLAFLMGYYWRAGHSSRAPKAISAAARPADRSAKTPMTSVTPPAAQTTTTPLAPTLPLDSPGFVLQVGAMGNESNADALSAALRQKNFPAFVFKHSADRLYRVAVGPFSDADSAAKTKAQLELQGFTPLLKNWTPE